MNPRNANLQFLDFQFLKLKKGKVFRAKFLSEEGLVTLLSGHVDWKIKNGNSPLKNGILGPRKNVFKQKSFSLYLGKNSELEVVPLTDSEMILVKTKCHKSAPSFLIKPNDVLVKKVGKDTFKRSVHHILREKDPAKVLIAGETFNEPGKWSSYPPHKHDQAKAGKEARLEEVYFFKVNPTNRFCFMRLYGKKNGKYHEKTLSVKNNDFVVIPFGYHPVSAPPDTQVYYFWALAGKKRQLRFSPDPAFV